MHGYKMTFHVTFLAKVSISQITLICFTPQVFKFRVMFHVIFCAKTFYHTNHVGASSVQNHHVVSRYIPF